MAQTQKFYTIDLNNNPENFKYNSANLPEPNNILQNLQLNEDALNCFSSIK